MYVLQERASNPAVQTEKVRRGISGGAQVCLDGGGQKFKAMDSALPFPPPSIPDPP